MLRQGKPSCCSPLLLLHIFIKDLDKAVVGQMARCVDHTRTHAQNTNTNTPVQAFKLAAGRCPRGYLGIAKCTKLEIISTSARYCLKISSDRVLTTPKGICFGMAESKWSHKPAPRPSSQSLFLAASWVRHSRGRPGNACSGATCVVWHCGLV